MLKISVDGNSLPLCFVCDENEFSGVKKIADKVRLDVQRVTGILPAASTATPQGNIPLIYGTLGSSPLIEKELSPQSLEKIRGKREVYAFFVTSSKIIIAGSDKRGTIYGLFHFSELLGVSPLVDWADILPVHKDEIELEEGEFISKEPSVRFRGFFINDEWPACGNWCNHNFGGFNAKMYEHVFELLLRLKGNYLWPAMWAARFSDDGPGLANAELADELGVIMGASHHEPCCRAGEEYKHLRGPDSIYGDAWNFRTNESGITKFWEDGLKRSGKFENVITVGMRGEADTAIMQNATLADNIQLLRDVLKTQNSLIKKYVNDDLDKVPRMLALYKEVEPYFYGDKHTKGLMDSPELEGVTLMLCDDNHGNLRTVPTEQMRNHKGGYGMYYHFDYHGSPFSYEWLNTNYLPKVKEQMTAAYDFGIRDLWIVNVGDIMTNEFPLSYFLDLAYDYEKYSKAENTVQDYTKTWINQQFPSLSENQKSEIDFIINAYTKLANMRRTECVWPDTFHPINFGESDKILTLANDIIARAEKLKSEIPENLLPGYFLEVYLPACGTMNVLRMQLYSGKNRWFAGKSALAANVYADKVRECYKYDQALVFECDKIDGGKFFASAWSEHFGFTHWCEAENHYPTYTYVEATRKKRFIAWIDGQEFTTSGQDWTNRNLKLTAFKNPDVKGAQIKIAFCCEGGASYNLNFADDCGKWLSASVTSDKEFLIDTITIKIDREKLAEMAGDSPAGAGTLPSGAGNSPAGAGVGTGAFSPRGLLKIESNDGHGARLLVNVEIDASLAAWGQANALQGDCPAGGQMNAPQGKSTSLSNFPAGTFIQTENYISMEAQHYFAKVDGVDDGHFEILPGYGKTLSAVKAFPVEKSYPKGKNAPYVEYKFALEKENVMTFDFYLNPSNPAYKDNKLQFIMEINGQKILNNLVDENFAVGDNQEPWGSDVTNNIRISSVYGDCCKGLNTLRIYPVTPNIVLEKIVIYPANQIMPDSYLGAPETYRKK